MCAIVGAASNTILKDSNWILNSLDVLKHRGPDDFGSWKSDCGKIHFGHRRLSILDLTSNGHQPMFDDSNCYTIIFNGEIYNHLEIRKQLLQFNINFNSESDTEVLLKSYIKWGVNCLNYLNGMFSFCIFDKIKNKLFLARDRSGEKPLYYTFYDNEFRFASELKGLIEDKNFQRKINLESFEKYLYFGYVTGENSMIQGIKKLPPAHYIEFDINTSNLIINEYWNLPIYKDSKLSEIDLLNKLENLLENSIKLQIKSDVNVCVLLSGGTDSTIVTALASRFLSNLSTYTIIFPDFPEFDESIQSSKVAKYFKTNHYVFDSSFIGVDILDRLVSQFDEPIIDSSIIPTYLITNKIKDYCKVALGGDGGDELFGGYNHYRRLLFIEKIQNSIPQHISNTISKFSNILPLGFKGKNWMSLLENDFSKNYLSISQYFNKESRNKLYNFGNGLDFQNELNSIKYFNNNIIDNVTKFDFKNYLLEDILVKVDRTSMLNSLELRAPFLDYNVINFAYSEVHTKYKVNRNCQKIILKQLQNKLMPIEQQNIKKGFSIPLKHWFRKGEWKDAIYESLINNNDSVFNQNYVKELLINHQFLCNNSERLFGLLFFQKWVDYYNIKF